MSIVALPMASPNSLKRTYDEAGLDGSLQEEATRRSPPPSFGPRSVQTAIQSTLTPLTRVNQGVDGSHEGRDNATPTEISVGGPRNGGVAPLVNGAGSQHGHNAMSGIQQGDKITENQEPTSRTEHGIANTSADGAREPIAAAKCAAVPLKRLSREEQKLEKERQKAAEQEEKRLKREEEKRAKDAAKEEEKRAKEAVKEQERRARDAAKEEEKKAKDAIKEEKRKAKEEQLRLKEEEKQQKEEEKNRKAKVSSDPSKKTHLRFCLLRF